MSVLESAINNCLHHPFLFKFISANDVGTTNSHQSGLYIPQDSWKLVFDVAGKKGENKDESIYINWNENLDTESRFIWYGKGTRSEYRLTRFGRGFPYLNDHYIGSLFVLVRLADRYRAHIIEDDGEIEEFLNVFDISPLSRGGYIEPDGTYSGDQSPTAEDLFGEYFKSLEMDFPDTTEISERTRNICLQLENCSPAEPDNCIRTWVDTEYELFKYIESRRYESEIKQPFDNLDQMIAFANSLLNRRKSRAGKSLEHHLAAIFDYHHLPYSHEAVTENNKKPDFLFPGREAYHNPSYPEDKLIVLGAKTTCKDRWRQVISEADRVETKHLFTLQQGISENQINEMVASRVQLVIPEANRKQFPKRYRPDLLNLEEFIGFVKDELKNAPGGYSLQSRLN